MRKYRAYRTNQKSAQNNENKKTEINKGDKNMAVIKITAQNFEAEVLNSDRPVLVDFWAAWCGPCRMLAPTVDEIAEERTDIKVGKVNVDEEEELAVRFGIMSIPTLILFRDGKPAGQTLGVQSKQAINNLIG
ncbi:MAG: thioredoxin [Ruminococcaceae bacterium]|nr:thioredoxin [Oscillospiraceae bacterium]